MKINRKNFFTKSEIINKRWIKNFKNPKILYFDINYFINYNYEYGHEEGDKVIKHIETIIKNYPCNFSRTGGDEWMILMDNNIDKKLVEEILDFLEKENLSVTFLESDYDEILELETLYSIMYLTKKNNVRKTFYSKISFKN